MLENLCRHHDAHDIALNSAVLRKKLRPSISWAEQLHVTLSAPSQHAPITGDKYPCPCCLCRSHQPCIRVIGGFSHIRRECCHTPNAVKQRQGLGNMWEFAQQYRMRLLLHPRGGQEPFALVAFHQNRFAQTCEHRGGKPHIGVQKNLHKASDKMSSSVNHPACRAATPSSACDACRAWRSR